MIQTQSALFFIILIFQVTCAFSQTTPDQNTIAYLKKFRTDYSRSVLEKNPDLTAGYFHDHIRLMPEFQKTILDKPNIITYYHAFATRFDTKAYTREPIETLDLGTRIIEFGLLSMKLVLKKTGQPHEIKGKYADIWERSSDGKLILITQAWNYNHQVPIASELIFNDVPAVNMAYQSHVPVTTPIAFELLAYNRLQEQVITEHNPKLWGMFYTDDYMLFYSNHPVYKGRKEVDAYLEEHVKHLPVFEKLDIRNDRIDELGDYVIEYATHIAIIRDGDWSGVGTGKNFRIWRREKNGTLRIFRGMAMYD